jgi:uncharacterized membrane protein
MAADIKEESASTKVVELKFRWKYILLPLIFLFISIALFLVFLWQLSPPVAYRFDPAGAPGSTTSREMLALFMLLPQLAFVLMGAGVTGTIIRISGSLGQLSQAPNPERLLILIGNLVIIPQIVFDFIMLDIFSYNINGSHLMPVWLFALIVMVIGGIILTLFLITTYMHLRTNT